MVVGHSLRKGLSRSCGCLRNEKVKEKLFKDISGKSFHFLTALECIGKRGRRREYWWKCKCDCGNFTEVIYNKLITGHTKSCGCLHNRVAKERAIIRNKEMAGPKHPRWNPDLTDEEREAAKEGRTNDPKLNRWRKKVYERDGYKCVKCKDDKGGNLIAHHIYSWNSHKKLRYVASNGSTLCEECHKIFHKKYGLGNNTRKQYNEWRKV